MTDGPVAAAAPRSRPPRPRVVLVDGVPMSGLLSEAADPRAVVVALHGGGTTSAYFDCPGHPELSLLRLAAAAGFTAVAIDRPGYGASAPYPDAMRHPDQRVSLVYGAVDTMLGDRPTGHGVFVLAHSNGCELAVRLAAAERGGELLGMALAGTGLRYEPAAAEILKAASPTNRPVGLRELLWEPAAVYPPEVLAELPSAASGAPYEAALVAGWPRRDFRELAPQVRIPVLFSRAEHERVWQSGPEAMAEIAALFAASPRVVTDEILGAGHNLSLGWTAAAYHLRVLSFVAECVAARQRGRTGMEVEAG